MVCSNGAVGIRRLSQPMVLALDTFSGTIQSALESTRRCVTAFTELDSRIVQNPGGVIGRLSERKVLNTQQVQQIVEEVAALGDEPTEYDLVNLITLQQHGDENNLRWLEAGGRTLDYLHTVHCASCGSHL